MALRAATVAAAAVARGSFGVRRLFSSTSSMPSFLNSKQPEQKREMAEPNTNLFISGLNKSTSSEKLRETFSQFGEVVDARVITDRVVGTSKGFGFVRYKTIEEASKAVKGMDGEYLEGWVIFAEYARAREPPTNFPGNNTAPPYGRQ
ncbi:hypothetical protein ACFE04_008925 [Oxalis oulophora]